MRIIKQKTLESYWCLDKYRLAKPSLQAWLQEAKHAEWKNHNELKEQFANASILGAKRVVFNIKGNDFRLIVDIEYRFQIIFIIWFGTHTEYDKIDAKTIRYDT